METAVILSAVRTPIGRMAGQLRYCAVDKLGAAAITAAVQRSTLSGDDVTEVIMGNVLSAGVGQAPARQAAWSAGLPDRVAALTINKVCGSGLKAVMLAAAAIRCGDADVVVAGGMESMSRAPYLLPRTGPPLGDRTLIDSMLHDGLVCAHCDRSMGQLAEQLAAHDGIAREDQDRYALQSHARAVAATQRGDFDAEIVPVDLSSDGGKAGGSRMEQDEGPRGDTTPARMSALPPVFSQPGCITAGNAAMISDGAAAVVVASQRLAKDRRLSPLARIVAYRTAGTAADQLFVAPVAAITEVLRAADLPLGKIDLWEINEAFAVQMLACQRRLKLSDERLNVCGGAIALGHPIGASGARVLTTLIHSLHRLRLRYGLAALCLGGGHAVAMIVERT